MHVEMGMSDNHYFLIMCRLAIPIFLILSPSLIMAGLWDIFYKAKRSNWQCLVPIYNLYVILRIAGLPRKMFFLLIIPGFNILFYFYLCIKLAERFGKNIYYGLGVAFLPMLFLPALAFGRATYMNNFE